MAARLALLDAFTGTDLQPAAAAFRVWDGVKQRIAELEQDEQLRLRLLDLWMFQKKEIEGAHPEPGEDERLEAEKRVLANSARIHTALDTCGFATVITAEVPRVKDEKGQTETVAVPWAEKFSRFTRSLSRCSNGSPAYRLPRR